MMCRFADTAEAGYFSFAVFFAGVPLFLLLGFPCFILDTISVLAFCGFLHGTSRQCTASTND